MGLQTQLGSGLSPSDAYNAIRGFAQTAKNVAQNTLAALQAGPVNTAFAFTMIDQLNVFIGNVTTWKSVTGLDAYATAQGYQGTMSADCTTAINAAQACVNWMVANFPAEVDGYIKAYKFNVADGTRLPNSFTSVQTAGLQTSLQSFIATIS